MYLKSLVATFACLATVNVASAQEYTFRLADALPPEHVIHRAVGKVFMEKVEEKTNGRVVFEHFPAGQLGKGEAILDAVTSGLADVGYVIPSHIQGKMTLSAVAELPGGYPDACTGTKALMALAMPGGLLDEIDFASNGVRVLAAVVLPPYQTAFASDAIDTLADIEGQKIRSNPGPMEMSINTLGGVPIRLTPSEIYDSLSKGTIDGFFLPYVSILSYGLDEEVRTVTEGANFGSVVITYSISTDKWESLPPEIQDALTAAGKEASLEGCRQFDEEEAAAGKKLQEKGIKFLAFTGEDADNLRDRFAELGDEWAALQEERGHENASEILSAFRNAAEKAKDTGND